MAEAGQREQVIRLMQEAADGGLRGMPPLPGVAAELFGESGWLRRFVEALPRHDLAEAAVAAEEEWNRRVLELLGRLTRMEAAAAALNESDPGYADYRRALRAEIDVLAIAVRDIARRDARGFLAEVGLLDVPAGPGGDAEPTPTDRLVAMLEGWAGDGDGVVRVNGLRIRRPDGGVTHWQVTMPDSSAVRDSGMGPAVAAVRDRDTVPDVVLRRLDAAPMQVAVFLDSCGEHAEVGGNRLAEDAAERARLRAEGTVVFQLTADDVAGSVAGAAAGGAPYEGEAQEAARRGYRILGGDPAELAGMIWAGGAGLLRAFLTDPDPERWRRAATAALAGLLVRPGGWRVGVSAETLAVLVRASLLGDALPLGPGRDRILARVLDASGCPVTVIIDQRGSGPLAPLGSWTGLAVIDDRMVAIRASEAGHRRRWTGWLYWGNVLQLLPDGRQLAYTRLGEFDPGSLEAADGTPAAQGLAAGGLAARGLAARGLAAQGRRLDSAWGGQVEVIDREVAVLGHALEFLGVPVPADDQVGYELGDEAWLAELAWPRPRVAVLAGAPGTGIPGAEVAEVMAAYQAAGWDARLARDWPPDELAARILAAQVQAGEVPSGH